MVRALKNSLGNARPWVRWTAAAAAAILCVLLGMGIQYQLNQRQVIDPPLQLVQGGSKAPSELAHEALEKATLDVHLELARMVTRGEELGQLVKLAKAIRDETETSVKDRKTGDLALLVWLHGRVLHDGIVKMVRQEGGGMTVKVKDDTKKFLKETEEWATNFLGANAPDNIGAPLRQLSRQAREVKAFVEGGPAPRPFSPQPPAEGHVLLKVMVFTTVELAHDSDPILRADASTQLVKAMADRLEQVEGADPKEVERLTDNLGKVLNDAVLLHLSNPISFEGPKKEERRQRLADVVKRLGDAGDRLEHQVLGRMLPGFQRHLNNSIRVTREVRKEPPRPGVKPSWYRQGYKDKGKR